VVHGSATALINNHMTANTYFVTYDANPFDKVALSFKVAYSSSKMAFDPITHWDGPYDEIAHLDFDSYDELHTYSDLDDDILDFEFDLHYTVNENLSVLFEANYNRFDDNQYYVYGDTSGRWFYGRFTVRYVF